MNIELSVNLVCLVMRNGVQIWVEKDRAQRLFLLLASPNAPQFIEYDGRLLNRADLTGIFTAQDMEDHTRRKNGESKCLQGKWHEKGRNCDCVSNEQRENIERREKAIRDCGKCRGGYISTPNGVSLCVCLSKF